jgi:hypothetical protein
MVGFDADGWRTFASRCRAIYVKAIGWDYGLIETVRKPDAPTRRDVAPRIYLEEPVPCEAS